MSIFSNRNINRRSFLTGLAAGGSGLAMGAGGILTPANAHVAGVDAGPWPTSTAISPSGTLNQIVDLPYSDGTYVEAKVVFNVDPNGIELTTVLNQGGNNANDTIITNLSESYAEVYLTDNPAAGIAKSLSPRSATVVRGNAWIKQATDAQRPSNSSTQSLHVAFIRTSSPRNIANMLLNRKKWVNYPWPSGIGPYPLWVSSQAVMTGLKMAFDPFKVANQQTPNGFKPVAFDIHTNMWWLPAMSDAAVHYCHYANFLEVHTQLMGVGRMQKFTDKVARPKCTFGQTRLGATPYPLGTTNPPPGAGYYGVSGIHDTSPGFPNMFEEYRLAPGDTNVPFPNVEMTNVADVRTLYFDYPWHQYYSDTDCLWVVWELVPVGQARHSSAG